MPYAVRTYAVGYNTVYGTTCVGVHIWRHIIIRLVRCKISSKTPLHPDAYIPIYPHNHPTFPVLQNIFKIHRFKPQENQKFSPSTKYILIFGMLGNLLYIQHMYLSPTKLNLIYYV